MTARLRLRRADGRVYLDRWGIESPLGGVFLHKMSAPDPGIDLHDHPWWFASLVLTGGYTEERIAARVASETAREAELYEAVYTPDGPSMPRGHVQHRHRWSLRTKRLDECHRITALEGDRPCWTLVVHGPKRRLWGFYLPRGWMRCDIYESTVRADRRDLWADITGNRPEGRP